MNGLNIFSNNIIKNNFFSPLNGEQKDLYTDFMHYLIKQLDRDASFKIERDRVRELIIDYIRANPIKYNKIDIIDDIEKLRNHAQTIMSTYIQCGWIEEEVDLSGQRFFIIKPLCITLFEWLESYMNANKQFLTGNFKSITNTLLSTSLEYNDITKAYNDTNSFKNSLKTLSNGMKTMIKECINNSNTTLEQISNNFINSLESPFFVDYYRLKDEENFRENKNKIVRQLELLINNENDKLYQIVKDYVDIYLKPESSQRFDIIEENYNKIKNKLIIIYNFFYDEYDEIFKEIEHERNRYFKIASEQMSIKISHDESEIIKIQKLISYSAKHDIDLSDFINLFHNSTINETSLTPKTKKEKVERISFLQVEELSEEEKKLQTRRIHESAKNNYTDEIILALIEHLMKDKEEIIISDIEVKSRTNLTELGAIPIYISQYDKNYEIIDLKEYYQTPYGEIKNYKIRRK